MALAEEEQGVRMEAPRAYLLHFCDDDAFRPGASWADLAEVLDPCRVVVLGYDEEAYACDTLAELAALFSARVRLDVAENPMAESSGAERLVLIGYAFGAIVAHQMAVQLRGEGGHDVALVLLDSEVAWPPAFSVERMGGYQWLGGDIEATLLLGRALGKADVCRKAVVDLTALPEGDRDADELQMRIFWELAPGGMTLDYFGTCVESTAFVLEKLHYVAASFAAPALRFDGPALLLRSSSPEFKAAEDVNRRHCSSLQVAQCRGTHYDLVQGDHAQSVARALTDFLAQCGFLGPALRECVDRNPPPGAVPGVDVLSEGDDPEATPIYLLHSMMPFVTPEWKERVAALLQPCRVAALCFDAQAAACESNEALAELYQDRILQDMKLHSYSNYRMIEPTDQLSLPA